MKIFPHIIGRVGGSSFSDLEIEDKFLNELLSLSSLLEIKDKSKHAITESLLKYNQTLSDKVTQNRIQNFRRDLHNERAIKDALLLDILKVAPAPIKDQIKEYFKLLANINRHNSELGAIYYHVDKSYSERLKSLSKSGFLMKGLLLSSQDLLNNLSEYWNTDGNCFKKQHHQTELGVFKYLSRSCAKTSPFSTFNNLMHCKVDSSSENAIDERNITDEISSHLRLNNYLYKFLRSVLLSIPILKSRIEIQCNPTIIKEKLNFLYLTNSNNIEAFQRLAINEVNITILDTLRNGNVETFSSLIEKLELSLKVEKAEVTNYLDQLLNYGFLEFYFPISGSDPEWDIKFVDYLENTFHNEFGCINQLAQSLRILRKFARSYEHSDTEERKQYLTASFNDLKSACKSLFEYGDLEFMDRESRSKLKPGNKEDIKNGEISSETPFRHDNSLFFSFRPETIFYEDSVRKGFFAFDNSSLTRFIDKLNFLFYETGLLDPKMLEIEKLKIIFQKKFSRERKVSLMKFYEEFSRSKIYENKKSKTTENGEITQGINETEEMIVESIKKKTDEFVKSSERWKENFAEIILGNPNIFQKEVVNFCRDDIAKLNVSSHNRPFRHSKGIFVQFFKGTLPSEENVLMGVLNAYFQGHGKPITRFLHLLNHSVTSDLKDFNNQSKEKNFLSAEITDASFFNANIHPNILEFEIQSPGSNSVNSNSRQLKVSDLSVRYNVLKDELELFHDVLKTTVFAYDLGLQSLLGRSKLYQLLEKFNSSDHANLFPIVHAINNSFSQKLTDRGYKFYPRIIFENQIVLQRKQWQFSKDQIPLKKLDQSELQYFISINDWRKMNSIPDEVFVKLDLKEFRASRHTAQNQPRKDDYKPQYIDFKIPICSKIFEKMINRVSNWLIIEEMLPGRDQLLQLNKKKYVTEFIVQWVSE